MHALLCSLADREIWLDRASDPRWVCTMKLNFGCEMMPRSSWREFSMIHPVCAARSARLGV